MTIFESLFESLFENILPIAASVFVALFLMINGWFLFRHNEKINELREKQEKNSKTIQRFYQKLESLESYVSDFSSQILSRLEKLETEKREPQTITKVDSLKQSFNVNPTVANEYQNVPRLEQIISDYNRALLLDREQRISFAETYSYQRVGILNMTEKLINQNMEIEFGLSNNGHFIAVDFMNDHLVFPYLAAVMDETVKEEMTAVFQISESTDATRQNKFQMIKPASFIVQGNLWRLKQKGAVENIFMKLDWQRWLFEKLQLTKESLWYLVPDNPVSFAAVLIVILVFFWFCFRKVLPLRNELKRELLKLSRLENRDFIEQCAVDKQLTKAENPSLVERIFYIIFDSGVKESRLEVQELTALAEENFEREIESLRAIVSSFIVIGLFGTLFGLAFSFGNLSQNVREYDTIKGLLPGLRNAFAPSIWGVGLTLLGLYFYSKLVSKHFNPYIARVKEVIVSLWIPILYPSSPQKWAEILKESAAELHGILEEIAESSRTSYDAFAQHVATMTENLTGLNQTLGDTNEVSKRFKTVLKGVEKTSNNLVEALENISNFQKESIILSKQFSSIVEIQSIKWEEHVGELSNTNMTLFKRLLSTWGNRQKEWRRSLVIIFQVLVVYSHSLEMICL